MVSDDTIKKIICKNITKYRKLAGLNQKEFAAKLGVAPSRVSSWETGANSTDIDTLFKICDILNISINDMCEIYPDANVMLTYLEQELIKKYRFIADCSPDGTQIIDMVLNREYSIAMQLKEYSKYILSPKQDNDNNTINIRVINYYYRAASAGTGQIIFDLPPTKRIEIPNIPKYKKVDYAIGVNGNSMEPLYSDGDILLVEMAESVEIGEIGIFRVNNESFVKKRGATELISLNPTAENITLNETAGCMGKVIGKLP